MAQCSIFKRTANTGNRRSHSNIATKRKFKINLQKRKIDGIKKTVCTKCIKNMTKVK